MLESSPRLLDRLTRKLWITLRGEASWVNVYGNLREKERHGLLERPNYAYGLLRAADLALYFGHRAVTACEFGVASGNGLLNMVNLAEMIGKETGVEFRIIGFDTGEGLPAPEGHKDHPELWSGGDFYMQDKEELLGRIDGRADIVFGDIRDTVHEFTASLDSKAPLGFVSIDVDIYSATRSSLECFSGPADRYCPAVSCYFDDVGFFFANEWCGELSAIREFNDEQETRKIDMDRSLPGRRMDRAAPWHRSMYVCHLLDHEARARPRNRNGLAISDHHQFMLRNFLY